MKMKKIIGVLGNRPRREFQAAKEQPPSTHGYDFRHSRWEFDALSSPSGEEFAQRRNS